MKNKLFKLTIATAVFVCGAGLAISQNKQIAPVEAAARQENFDPYSYSGTYYNSLDTNGSDGVSGGFKTALGKYVLPKDLAPVAKKKVIIKLKQPKDFTAQEQTEEESENKLIESAKETAAAAPKIKIELRRNRSFKANRARPLTEAETRELIDEQLRKVGWECDTNVLNQKLFGTKPQKGHNMAIAEWQTDSKIYNHGYADYALFKGKSWTIQGL